MKLPAIEVPTYSTTLLSTGRPVKYRPYTVKHEKILLIALESQDMIQIIDAIYNLIDDCVDGVDVRALSNFDLESLFIAIRSKSVGEGIKLSMKCEKCEGRTPAEYDLTDYTISGEIKRDVKIQISDKIGIALRYPTMYKMKKYLSEDSKGVDQVYGAAICCIDYIYDDQQIYKADEASEEDLQSFLGSLTTDQFKQITGFMDEMPKISKTVEFDCESCKHHNVFTVEGLEGFFM